MYFQLEITSEEIVWELLRPIPNESVLPRE